MTTEGVNLVHARDTAAHSAGQCRVVYPETTHVPLFRRIAAAAWQRCLVSLTLAFGLALPDGREAGKAIIAFVFTVGTHAIKNTLYSNGTTRRQTAQ